MPASMHIFWGVTVRLVCLVQHPTTGSWPFLFFDVFQVPWRYLKPTPTHDQAHQICLALLSSCYFCLYRRGANCACSWIFPFASVVGILAFGGYRVRFYAASSSNQHHFLANMPPIYRAMFCAAFYDPLTQRWQRSRTRMAIAAGESNSPSSLASRFTTINNTLPFTARSCPIPMHSHFLQAISLALADRDRVV